MRAYLKLKKIDVPIEDTTVYGDTVPQKGKDYTLLVKVALKSFERTQVEADEEDEEVYYFLELTGPVHLLPEDFENVAETIVSSDEGD
jgi:hypothetical protein